MVDVLTLQGDYGYTNFNVRNDDVDVIDASDASWTLANIGSMINRYPFQVVNNDANVRIIGGTINGQVSLTLDWSDAYENSAAVRVEDTPLATIEDWRISKAWDGIRVNGDSPGFKIDNVWLSDIRDDAIENDVGMSGAISNSLFDGVFVGLSMATRDGANRSNEIVTMDNVLIGMESYLYKGSDTHMSPFKIYTTSPKMEMYDTIIAIEDVKHHGFESLERAWDKVVAASGNYLLNLSDTPLPSNYPLPKGGFTILQGQEARALWNAERTEWIAKHDSADTPTDFPEPTDGGQDPDAGATDPADGSIKVGIFDTASDALVASVEDGDVFRIKDLPGSQLTLSVEVVEGGDLDGDVGSMRLTLLNGNTYSAVENGAPYALFGDERGDLDGGIPLRVGDYSFEIEVYAGRGGGGALLDTIDLNFRVVDDLIA